MEGKHPTEIAIPLLQRPFQFWGVCNPLRQIRDLSQSPDGENTLGLNRCPETQQSIVPKIRFHFAERFGDDTCQNFFWDNDVYQTPES